MAKARLRVDIGREPADEKPLGVCMLEKVCQIRSELAAALEHSAHVRSVLFGEGESNKSEKPSEGNIGGILHDIFDQACRLRDELERTGEYLQPRSAQPKQVGHAR